MYHKAVSNYCVTYACTRRIYLLLISYLISKQPRVNTLRVSCFSFTDRGYIVLIKLATFFLKHVFTPTICMAPFHPS